MTGLAGIPVRVLEATGNAVPVLCEVAALLDNVVQGGPGGSIDLRSLPMLPGDHAMLEQYLGLGEVSAEVDALGPTRIRETAIHGVWRVVHCNAEGETVAEFIEVRSVPLMLSAPVDDMREGLETLRARLTKPT